MEVSKMMVVAGAVALTLVAFWLVQPRGDEQQTQPQVEDDATPPDARRLRELVPNKPADESREAAPVVTATETTDEAEPTPVDDSPPPTLEGVEIPEHYPTFDDLPESQRPAAMGELSRKLDELLEGRDDADSYEVGEPDCTEVPCMVPVTVADGRTERYAAVTMGAEELTGDMPIVVTVRQGGGVEELHLYWNPPGGDGQVNSVMQLLTNIRARQ